MEIQERFKAITDEWVGKEEENRNRAVVVIAIDKDTETISGVIQGRSSLVVGALTQIIKNESKDNLLGRLLRKAQTRAALHHMSDFLGKLLGDDEKGSEKSQEGEKEQSETAAEKQGGEASHE